VVTFSSHASHALQPIDVSCFKPIKITIKKERNNAMAKNNYKKPYKITQARWVHKSLDYALSNQNIKFDLRMIGIWSLNPRAMEDKILFNEVYTKLTIIHKMEKKKKNMFHVEINHSPRWGKGHVTICLMNIVKKTSIIVEENSD
jgi:hypothetical protein